MSPVAKRAAQHFSSAEPDLFGLPSQPQSLPGWPPGLVYEDGFLSAAEEQGLIAWVQAQPLQAARYRQYTARRRVLSFGGSFDYDSNRLLPAAPLDPALLPLRARVAAWMGVPAGALVHALVAEYQPGTPLGWHRDVPDFEEIAGVSLGSAAPLCFRPWPPAPEEGGVLRLEAAPRSIYRMAGPARWAWQHGVPPVPALRWSITFRTARRPLPVGPAQPVQ